MKTVKRFIIIQLALILLIGLGACGTSTTTTPSGAGTGETTQLKNTVIIEDYRFEPAEITINVGETVTWINKGSSQHTVTGASFDSGSLSTGAEYQWQFTEAGIFDYSCTFHTSMTGKVIVK